MTTDEDRPPPAPAPRVDGKQADGGGADTWARRARRRLKGAAPEQRLQTRHFLMGLSYGFALGFILEAILASHP
jgi:hypothetical protein